MTLFLISNYNFSRLCFSGAWHALRHLEACGLESKTDLPEFTGIVSVTPGKCCLKGLDYGAIIYGPEQ